MKGKSVLLGAHVSVAGGFDKGLAYALEVGCECMQFFSKNARQWHARAIEPDVAEAFRRLRADSPIGGVFGHASYLLGLAATDEAHRQKSVLALADELTRASMLGMDGLVTHLGSASDGDRAAAAYRVAEAVSEALSIVGDSCTTRLLLENTAASGNTFGSTFEELSACISLTGVGDERLGVCLDTCHAFAAGVPLDSRDGWLRLVDSIDSSCGLERLGLIHANDSLFECGARKDRHAWIGDGFIGMSGFSAMFEMPELEQLCVCTEMPGEVPEKDITNLARLRQLRAESRNG